jgi:hypothetical protein
MLIGLIVFGYLMPWVFSYADEGEEENEGKIAMRYKRFKRSLWFLPLAVIMWISATFVPSTETTLKIIATKKGADAAKFQTVQGSVDELTKIVDNGLKFLNQTIEKELNKTVEEEKK